ncbi:hypothetical protein MKQ68_09260 [Chitinophaga horti]|uniref:Uncharacterized protein n=1 Tax=Chitinophaga horti TaxID=2920382 RepID=A0ABY6J6I2_9BACT|nr:hypothetical protein [Chitinophaga horti]UYQ95283.1 hypothetical protein MKQ68_09260 [Chitinophaga horti]
MKTVLYIFLALAGVVLYFNGKAWWRKAFPPEQQYGVEFNKERAKRRMLLLPRSWKSTDSTADSQTWSAEETTFDKDTAYRKSKTIRLEKGRIVFEEDWIERFRKDSSFNEYLVFGYHYDSLLPLQVNYSRTGTAPVSLSRWESDSLMRVWHVRKHLD